MKLRPYAVYALRHASPSTGSLKLCIERMIRCKYQYSTPLVLIVPLFDVDVQALVYGNRMASGTARGLAGEYAGRGFLAENGKGQSPVMKLAQPYLPVGIGRFGGEYQESRSKKKRCLVHYGRSYTPKVSRIRSVRAS